MYPIIAPYLDTNTDDWAFEEAIKELFNKHSHLDIVFIYNKEIHLQQSAEIVEQQK
ncbi:hypothetical protein [Psychrobacillus glaciei]|uniref:hypothetical protein n=1 Tax=Psychrobacillus glaciei TaxID=2283160 RepID=UPI00178C2366|nr:hypothetical protein [Psychrobacillus glaciei]